MRKLTQNIVKQAVNLMGGQLAKTDYGDFKLKINGQEYFTDSVSDVLETAYAITGSREADEFLVSVRINEGPLQY